jgi:hypothetical protein
MSNTSHIERVRGIALRAGYTLNDINAGIAFVRRRDRIEHPPGHFDRAGRFYASERTKSVRFCRAPSRRWPYPEMHAARTAAHCAEVFGAREVLAVRRVARALDLAAAGASDAALIVALAPVGTASAHVRAALAAARKTLRAETSAPTLVAA